MVQCLKAEKIESYVKKTMAMVDRVQKQWSFIMITSCLWFKHSILYCKYKMRSSSHISSNNKDKDTQGHSERTITIFLNLFHYPQHHLGIMSGMAIQFDNPPPHSHAQQNVSYCSVGTQLTSFHNPLNFRTFQFSRGANSYCHVLCTTCTGLQSPQGYSKISVKVSIWFVVLVKFNIFPKF